MQEERGDSGEGGRVERRSKRRRRRIPSRAQLTSARTGKIPSIRYERLPRSAIRIPVRLTHASARRIHAGRQARTHARMHACTHARTPRTHVRPRGYCLKRSPLLCLQCARSHAAGTTAGPSPPPPPPSPPSPSWCTLLNMPFAILSLSYAALLRSLVFGRMISGRDRPCHRARSISVRKHYICGASPWRFRFQRILSSSRCRRFLVEFHIKFLQISTETISRESTLLL